MLRGLVRMPNPYIFGIHTDQRSIQIPLCMHSWGFPFKRKITYNSKKLFSAGMGCIRYNADDAFLERYYYF